MLHTNPTWIAPRGKNRIGLQFGCISTSEVDKTYNKIIAADITI